jgi:glycosyltransferase involved in cell wall biosynthesis
VVDPSDPQAVLAAVEKLFREPARRREMGEKGRQRFQAHFTRDRFEERLRRLLGEG